MKFINVIPARKNSKGIKNKNIFKICKKNLVEYTFEAAKKSKVRNNFVLTDSILCLCSNNEGNINLTGLDCHNLLKYTNCITINRI